MVNDFKWPENDKHHLAKGRGNNSIKYEECSIFFTSFYCSLHQQGV